MAKAYQCDRCGEYHLDIWFNRFDIERNYQTEAGSKRLQKYVLTLCPKCVSSLHLRDDSSKNAFDDMIAQLAYENPTPDPEEEKNAETDLKEEGAEETDPNQLTLDEVKKEESTDETQHD